MEKVWIKGNAICHEGVLTALLKHGGINKNNYDFKQSNLLFFIGRNDIICSIKDDKLYATWLKQAWVEMQPLFYQNKQKFYDKQLVWGYNCEDSSRELGFYDAKNACMFNQGKRGGFVYDNYEPFEGEYPQWAKDELKRLED